MRRAQSTRWWYKLPGTFYASGPTTHRYNTERAARRAIRAAIGVDRLPRGTEVYRYQGTN